MGRQDRTMVEVTAKIEIKNLMRRPQIGKRPKKKTYKHVE